MQHPSNLKFHSGLGALLVLPAIGAAIGTFLTEVLDSGDVFLGLNYLELGLAATLAIAFPRFLHLQITRLNYLNNEKRMKSSHRERIKAINLELERKKQEQLLFQIRSSVEKAATDQIKLPVCMIKTEEYLAKAIQNFNESAYSPFWLNIENCLVELCAFTQYTNEVLESWREYEKCNRQLRLQNPVRFPVLMQNGENVGLCRKTAQKLSETTRMAQKEFKFAIIAENKRTNAIWEEGLLPLNDAIDMLEKRTTTAIAELTQMVSAVANLSRTLNAGHEGADYSMYAALTPESGELKNLFAETQKTLTTASSSTEQAWEALDNIQRGNKQAVKLLLNSLAIENI